MIVQNASLTANGTPLPTVLTEPPAAPDSDVGALRASARQAYRDSIVNGRPLSGRELGGVFDRSERWGRDHIAEARAEDVRAGNETPAPPDEDGDAVNGCRPAAERQPQRGRAIAWAAFTSGIAASIAANVQHAQLQTMNPAAWIGSAFWPVALMLAIEVLTRVEWPRGSRWYAVARYGGTGLVALVAAVISYRHMAGLLSTWGEDGVNAHLGPLAVDGLMVVAAAALLVMNGSRR